MDRIELGKEVLGVALCIFTDYKKTFQNQIFGKVRILSRILSIIFKLVIPSLSPVEEEVSIDNDI